MPMVNELHAQLYDSVPGSHDFLADLEKELSDLPGLIAERLENELRLTNADGQTVATAVIERNNSGTRPVSGTMRISRSVPSACIGKTINILQIAKMNAAASVGALGNYQTSCITAGSAFSVYAENNPWRQIQLPLAVHAMTGSIPFGDSRKQSASLSTGNSALSLLQDIWSERLDCSFDGGVFKANLQDGEFNTGVLTIRRNIHPALGSGVSMTLALSAIINSPFACATRIRLMNEEEKNRCPSLMHFGAWFTPDEKSLCYETFLPDGVWNDTIIGNWPIYSHIRAKNAIDGIANVKSSVVILGSKTNSESASCHPASGPEK